MLTLRTAGLRGWVEIGMYSILLLTLLVPVYLCYEDWSSTSWPTSQARITKSQIKTTIYEDEDGGSDYRYKIDLEYEFRVEQDSYNGNNLRFDGNLNHHIRGVVEQERQLYPVGLELPVSYHPDRPGLNVLLPGTAGFPWFHLVFAGGWFLLCWLCGGPLKIAYRDAGRQLRENQEFDA